MDEQNKINNEEKIKELEKKLEEAEKLKNDYLEGWQRERAEFLNFQKEIEKRNEEIIIIAAYSINRGFGALGLCAKSFHAARCHSARDRCSEYPSAGGSADPQRHDDRASHHAGI